MLWLLVLAVGPVTAALAQPTECHNSTQCNEGFYCEPPGACRPCLRCEDLKRETMPTHVSCVTSVSQCGLCFPGLVEDPSGNVNAECVPAGSVPPPGIGGAAAGAPGAHGPPSYLWITLGAGLLLLLVIIGVVIYVLRNNDTLKILASTRASLQSPCAPVSSRGVEAGPGEVLPPPPPYNTQYVPVRPTSPPLDGPGYDHGLNGVQAKEESTQPFLKRVESRRERAPRDHSASQAARMFNKPHYVRGPELPPSYDAALSDESGPELHDENTMESIWTPAAEHRAEITQVPEPAASSPAVGAASAITSAGDDAAADEPRPSKMLCTRQDSNNNNNNRRDGGEGPSSSSGPPPAAPAPPAPGPSLTFNITVQQHNDLKLIRT